MCASYVPRVFQYSNRDCRVYLAARPNCAHYPVFTRCSAAIAFHHGFTCTSHVQLSHSRRRKFSGPRRWSSSPPWRRSRSPPQREYRRETTRHSYFEQDQYSRGRGYDTAYENSRRYRERSRSPPSQRFSTRRMVVCCLCLLSTALDGLALDDSPFVEPSLVACRTMCVVAFLPSEVVTMTTDMWMIDTKAVTIAGDLM